MADEIASRETLVDYVRSDASLLRYAASSEDAITNALAAAHGEVLGALYRSGKYDTDAIAALTSATAPADLRDITHARALHHLTKSGGARPDLIGIAATEAKGEISLIATGNRVIIGITASTPASSGAGSVGHYRRSESVFERPSTGNSYTSHDGDI